mmetsp:Transcript_20864/g.37317  ORF Transcript_20864/g.37317 Transcript_20864/m.37317 type:complete len:241 (-) Transcript_20864:142-864(-)
MHDQCASHPHPLERICHERRHFRIIHANQPKGGFGWIKERPKNVKRRTDFQGGANRADSPHGRMVARRHHESHTDLIHATANGFGTQVNSYAQLLKDVGGAAKTRDGTVAMLRDLSASGRGKNGGAGRDVYGSDAIAARAYDVHHVATVIDNDGFTEHGLGKAGNFFRCLTLGPKENEECSSLLRRKILQKTVKSFFGFYLLKILVVNKLDDNLLHRKLAIRIFCYCFASVIVGNRSNRR